MLHIWLQSWSDIFLVTRKLCAISDLGFSSLYIRMISQRKSALREYHNKKKAAQMKE